jgi:N-acyl-phosphatidylethanolamine-hydrolysing phospholipase D
MYGNTKRSVGGRYRVIIMIGVLAVWTSINAEVRVSEARTLAVVSQPWYSTAHHLQDGDGFQNIWTPKYEASGLRALGWIAIRPFTMWRDYSGIPQQKMDPGAIKKNLRDQTPRRFRAHWIGQATALIEFYDRVILTDPVFASRASPVSFAGPPRLADLPIQIEELPPIDVVAISHTHYDHLDLESLVKIHKLYKPLFVVPLGVQAILVEEGITNVIELDWYQYVDLAATGRPESGAPGTGKLRIHCTPARHFSNRSLADRNETLWAGWMFEAPEKDERIFFAGDTGYSPHFREIRERLGAPTLAILPIGAYLPRWFMREVHVDPEEAVQAFVDLDAEHFMAMHWGTFDLADEPILDPMRNTRTAAEKLGLPPERVHILPIGGQVAD